MTYKLFVLGMLFFLASKSYAGGTIGGSTGGAALEIMDEVLMTLPAVEVPIDDFNFAQNQLESGERVALFLHGRQIELKMIRSKVITDDNKLQIVPKID